MCGLRAFRLATNHGHTLPDIRQSEIRASGGVARMSDPEMILSIKKAVTIPVMAKARIGHFVEAQVRMG